MGGSRFFRNARNDGRTINCHILTLLQSNFYYNTDMAFDHTSPFTEYHDLMRKAKLLSNPPKGWNIELTGTQFDYLCNLLMEANQDEKIVGRGWDVQTFDNLVDNVCNAKETYLSQSVRGVPVR